MSVEKSADDILWGELTETKSGECITVLWNTIPSRGIERVWILEISRIVFCGQASRLIVSGCLQRRRTRVERTQANHINAEKRSLWEG